MTTEEKLQLIDYMREQANGQKTIVPPGQQVTRAISTNSPLGIMRYGSFQQGLDKMPPEMKQTAIDALKYYSNSY